jgi:hypothetical protein
LSAGGLLLSLGGGVDEAWHDGSSGVALQSTCANALCVCGTTAPNNTTITGTIRIAIKEIVIIASHISVWQVWP